MFDLVDDHCHVRDYAPSDIDHPICPIYGFNSRCGHLRTIGSLQLFEDALGKVYVVNTNGIRVGHVWWSDNPIEQLAGVRMYPWVGRVYANASLVYAATQQFAAILVLVRHQELTA
jgi:hypothetical protein